MESPTLASALAEAVNDTVRSMAMLYCIRIVELRTQWHLESLRLDSEGPLQYDAVLINWWPIGVTGPGRRIQQHDIVLGRAIASGEPPARLGNTAAVLTYGRVTNWAWNATNWAWSVTLLMGFPPLGHAACTTAACSAHRAHGE